MALVNPLAPTSLSEVLPVPLLELLTRESQDGILANASVRVMPQHTDGNKRKQSRGAQHARLQLASNAILGNHESVSIRS